jgi:hypothetical protein
MMYRIVFALLLVSSFGYGQKQSKKLLAALQKHTYYLASDELQGRRAGDAGEKLASQYIADQFKNNGLLPKGSAEYFQPFEINDGRRVDEKTNLKINGKSLKLKEEFEVLSNSSSGSLVC